jgi:DNA-binding PadR family transcriptional regulator
MAQLENKGWSLKPVCAAHVVAGMPPSSKSVSEFLPLRPVEFEILLTLAGGERHGYAIIQETAERSCGALQLETGTMYRALRRLVDDGLARPAARKPVSDTGDERRRYYVITALGARVAAAEALRMDRLVMAARAVRLLPFPATS